MQIKAFDTVALKNKDKKTTPPRIYIGAAPLNPMK